jgi:hypothetical protein
MHMENTGHATHACTTARPNPITIGAPIKRQARTSPQRFSPASISSPFHIIAPTFFFLLLYGFCVLLTGRCRGDVCAPDASSRFPRFDRPRSPLHRVFSGSKWSWSKAQIQWSICRSISVQRPITEGPHLMLVHWMFFHYNRWKHNPLKEQKERKNNGMLVRRRRTCGA